jgi:hypothetical protein
MELIPFFRSSYKDFAPTKLGIASLESTPERNQVFNPAPAGLAIVSFRFAPESIFLSPTLFQWR